MKKLLLSKRIKASKRGITFSFKEKGSAFDVGEHYKYIIDKKSRKIVILPSSDENSPIVSKKNAGGFLKSLFDIRKKNAVSAFKNCDYLQVNVYDDTIIVEGFVETADNINEKGKELSSNIVDIRQFAKVKKVAGIRLKKDVLAKVVGDDFGQLDLFEYIENLESKSVKTESKTVDFTRPIKNIKYPLQVVSLFSGAGILDYAFMKEGFDIVFSLDYDEDAVLTHRKNLGEHAIYGDVCTYPKDKVPQAKIIIGGPSCKPFSLVRNDRSTIKGQIENHKDSKLVAEYIKWIKSEYASYDLFILENVPQLLTSSDGCYLEMIKNELSDFEITYGIVNDAEQGGFQVRKRAIIAGSKIGKVEIPRPKVPAAMQRTVGEAIAKVDSTWPNYHDVSKPSEMTLKRMSFVPQGGNFKNIPDEYKTKGKFSNHYRRLDPSKPSVTLVNYRKPVIIHPFKNRILSVSEAASITGLEKDFEFMGKLSSKQQQVGNAVPVSLGRAVARAVMDTINKYCKRNNMLADACL